MNDLQVLEKQFMTGEAINAKNAEIYLSYLYSCSTKSYETMNTTYRTYLSNMRLYLVYLKRYEGNRLLISDDTIKHCIEILERFINYCRRLGNNNRTINNKITAISSFYIWANKRNLIKYHPFQDKLDRLKVTQLDKRREEYFLTLEDIITVNIKMNMDKRFDIQDKLLWNLFIDSGCRISAIWNLKFSSIDWEQGYFTEVREKETKIVAAFFFQKSKELLKLLKKEREEQGDVEGYIFLTKYNKKVNHMSKETIRARFKKMGQLIGIEGLYPHCMRKTLGNLMAKQGYLEEAALLLNHESSKTTKKHYTQALSYTNSRAMMERIRNSIGL
ncbi:tyrosine-type recombinase/integrase [Fusobacterium ulcerans]|uniref:Tyr recombinase domain-containing protein n=1 Tax=Fusobacterium ulcerans 12-1B TaxID=457404 RepID=H1PTP9_9FUSO|nr:site-specific integrase [Fusobacterium ulcerans]EHO80719.1 hypothetical protein HMPREF0402_01792 [Fusobacterium ulcerans 12-1B]